MIANQVEHFAELDVWRNENRNILTQHVFTWDPVFKTENSIPFIASEYMLDMSVSNSTDCSKYGDGDTCKFCNCYSVLTPYLLRLYASIIGIIDARRS